MGLLVPVALVTGSFFPELFEIAAHKPLAVFASDSVGAALGSLVSFFVPIVFGFQAFFALGAVVFWLTAFCAHRFFDRLGEEPVVATGD